MLVLIILGHCRAARALLYWSQPDLTVANGITRETIANFERTPCTPRLKNLKAIRAALEAAGVVFIDGADTIAPACNSEPLGESDPVIPRSCNRLGGRS